MSATTTSAPASPSVTCTKGIFGAIDCGSGSAIREGGRTSTINSLVAAIAYSFLSFAVQVLIFMVLRLYLTRIYRPRSYLVPEKDRVPPPPSGPFGWLIPLFRTPNLAFIQKCGLDAYFFLRFLRTLLKFFVPVAVVVLPILLPINRYSWSGTDKNKPSGLDVLSISNVGPKYVESRLWAHLILAVGVIVWLCYIIYQEMRGYIRVRQAYLTSPQHRIRASATTVLVSGIPRKWLTLEALSGLYDVFPGGIKNIWINRNFDKLSEKVKLRDNTAKNLEDAETALIKQCRKKHAQAEKAAAKKVGGKESKDEMKKDKAAEDAATERLAQSGGVSAGDHKQAIHGLQDMLHEAGEQEEKAAAKERERQLLAKPLDIMNHGFGAVGHGLGNLGKGVGALGHKTVGGASDKFAKAGERFTRPGREAGNGKEAATAGDDHLPQTPVQEQNMPEPHPLAPSATTPSHQLDGSPTSGETLNTPAIEMTRPSVESRPRSEMHIELPESHQSRNPGWQIWKNNDKSLVVPSPQPHTADEDEFPLNANTVAQNNKTEAEPNMAGTGEEKRTLAQKLMFWKSNGDDEDDAEEVYETAIDENWDEDQDGEPVWRRYIAPKDRQTIRLPVVSWLFSMPCMGQKVDRIYYLRRELARLNLEIEADQNNVEQFPLMSSAFIQFNHQVAAHMACQSVSHHVPQYMTPRLVEISPDDVIWDNMSIKWWERYIRTAAVIIIDVVLIVLWAIPVIFTGLLNSVSSLGDTYPWLKWINDLSQVGVSIIQGVLPPILLSLVLLLAPILFRLLVKLQGVPTGSSKERGVQTWYFAFLFIQVFVVATLSSGLTTFFATLTKNPGKVVTNLATSLPKAANYFFYYLLVQGLSNSATALLQVLQLLFWFLWAPMVDSTPRSKWRRQTNLNNVMWGSFFPPFANFAVIGIIYSTIAPFILVFMVIIFGVFWIAYRYNILYVYQFRGDTGGLLYPTALNQLFTGVYFLELCLIGLFFTRRNQYDDIVCIPQAVIMIIVMVFTALFQWQLNRTFKPLFEFLPITLEDEAVIRDEVFAKAQESKFARLNAEDEMDDEDAESLQDVLEARERAEEDGDREAVDKEKRDIHERRRSSNQARSRSQTFRSQTSRKPSWQNEQGSASPHWKTDRWRRATPHAAKRLRHLSGHKNDENATTTTIGKSARHDAEAQTSVGDVLYSGYADELEDLTAEERDLLVRYSFQHTALRSRRPVVWIPRDALGVSDDEIRRAEKMSTVESTTTNGENVKKTNIWISNEGTALDAKGRSVFRRSPPDFSNVDLIAL